MSLVAKLLSRDAHPFVQFIKYGLCGVAATVVHQGIFYVLSYYALPAADGMMVNGQPITDAMRYTNGIINNCIAFIPSCALAYITNVLWVFTPGKHSRTKEIAMFFGIAIVAFLAALFGGPMLIKWFGIPTWAAQLGFMITAFLVNFTCRKFLIFKK